MSGVRCQVSGIRCQGTGERRDQEPLGIRDQGSGDSEIAGNNMGNSYKDLVVWQKAMDLVVETYKIVKQLPKEETYALSDQMRRAAVSIPSNIAEGQVRISTKEYVRHLSIARGSNAELQTQLLLCLKLQYATEEFIAKPLGLSEEVGKMIQAIIQKLENED